MVCVDIDETTGEAEVRNVVLGCEPEDLSLARDHEGGFLVYDENMERVENEARESKAVATTEFRGMWSSPDRWEMGADAARFPGLYDPVDDDEDEDDDLEPLDLDEHVVKS
jgi:hypothetical protein